MAYPFFSNSLYEHRQEEVIYEYQKETDKMDTTQIHQMLKEAEEYNVKLKNREAVLTDPFDPDFAVDGTEEKQYEHLLDLESDGIMGYIEIPEINVFLPVYHGTSQEVLRKGVGHLENTSLPVGGKDTHCVLSAHTGLSDKKLFTDLVLLKKGLKELKQDVEAVDADGKILSDGTDSDVDGMNAEDFVQEEKDIQPEPEYAPWSSRKKKDAPEEMHDFADTAENAAAEEKHVEEVDISRMEESLDDVQISEEEVSSGETEHSFSETEGDIPPAGRGAYTVSQPTITDEDLSDMKDESLLDVISRKRKDSRKENE